jgi:ABC-type transporter Mla subunit MlaD
MGAEEGAPEDLPRLRHQAGALLSDLQVFQQEWGAFLEQLAGVDWGTLAQQGKLAGIAKFRIERTIADARNVLANGLQDLEAILRQAQQPTDDIAERLQALIRLYTDAPGDLRTRQQRLTAWLAAIDEALQQRGEQPLTAQWRSAPQASLNRQGRGHLSGR